MDKTYPRRESNKMSQFPFQVDGLSETAKDLMVASDAGGRLKLANQLREDVKLLPKPNNHIALAWTLTEVVGTGVFIDDVWSDIQEAQKSLDCALALDPDLTNAPLFAEQQDRTGAILDRVAEFEQVKRDEVAVSKGEAEENIDAKQAAEIAYASKDPEEIAHYFLLAAKKCQDTNPSQAEWYLNSSTSALLELERWDEAQPQLQKMTKGNTSQDFWIELGHIGLLRIAAAKSDANSFRKIWKAARSARASIPGSSPQYYKVIRFGIDHDLIDFVVPVFEKLNENKVYNKTKDDEDLLELASKYIAERAPQTPLGKLRSLFDRLK